MSLVYKVLRRLRRTWRQLARFQSDHSESPQRARKRNRYKRSSSSNSYDALDFLRSDCVRHHHETVVNRIRTRLATESDSKLRVAFVVSSPSRWNSDSILLAISEHPRVSAELVVCRPEYQVADEEVTRLFKEALTFYGQLGVPVREGYDLSKMEIIPIEDFDYDVYFFEMPWGMRDYPLRVTGRGLPAYLHYGFMMMANHGMHYNVASFHSYLWRYFTQTESHRRLHLEFDPNAAPRILVTGYPKLDVYQSQEDVTTTRAISVNDARTKRPSTLTSPVIYAPHHSLGKQYLAMSTFDWSGPAMLRMAEDYESLSWVYKPHPSLWFNVDEAGHMSPDEYSQYERQWSELPNAVVYDSGRYFDLFMRSGALVTCSGSFLAEYLPTGRPILWLRSSATVGFNRIGERLSEGFYVVTNESELHEVFDRVVVRGDDHLLETRRQLISEILPRGTSAGRFIVEHLTNQLVPEGDRPVGSFRTEGPS